MNGLPIEKEFELMRLTKAIDSCNDIDALKEQFKNMLGYYFHKDVMITKLMKQDLGGFNNDTQH